MLRARLFAFLRSLAPNTLTIEEEKQIVRAVLLYVVRQTDAAQFRKVSRTLGVTEELYAFKSEFLDRNYYVLSQFWRVVFAYFKQVKIGQGAGPEIAVTESAFVYTGRQSDTGSRLSTTRIESALLRRAMDSVPTLAKDQRRQCAADVRLLEDFLTLDDHRRLHELADGSAYDTPTDVDLQPVIDKLRSFSFTLAKYKTRFIAKHDLGVAIDDMGIEIFEAGLRTIREFDSDFSNGEKLLNTAKVAARNHCSRLIDYYTTQMRSRVVQIKTADGVEYRPTTVSINQEIAMEGSSLTLQDVIEDEVDSTQQSAEQKWLTDLLHAVPAGVSRVVKITLGGRDPEFETWLEGRSKHSIHKMKDATIAKYACEFASVPMDAVRQALMNDDVIASQVRMAATA